jgi:hypothetical protein
MANFENEWRIWGRMLTSLIFKNIQGGSVESAVCYLTRWDAVTGGNIAL